MHVIYMLPLHQSMNHKPGTDIPAAAAELLGVICGESTCNGNRKPAVNHIRSNEQ